MERTPIERALAWAKNKGLNQSGLANLLGAAPQDITNWKARGMPTDWHEKVALALGRSVDELLGRFDAADQSAEPAGRPGLLRQVKIVGIAKLGNGGYYEQVDDDGLVDSYSADPNAYALRVKGDSMHPAIRHGEIVVVEPRGQCVPGEYVAIALVDGRRMVKELVIERIDEVVVESVNGNHRQTIERASILQMHPVTSRVSPSRWRPE
ncbi:MAG: hypothetical protein RLZZ598_1394 [Pseudomonadota bacterium]|jgi:phage repressor protein C with HTH and peptisase S24 domain